MVKVSSGDSIFSTATIKVIIFVIEAGYIFSSAFLSAKILLFSISIRTQYLLAINLSNFFAVSRPSGYLILIILFSFSVGLSIAIVSVRIF